MRVTDLSSLARAIDPRYPRVGAILAAALLVTVAGGGFHLLQGASLQESAVWGVNAGLAVFLAWALGRELDPEHESSAFVGSGLALAGSLLLGAPGLLVLLWLLLVLRLVNQTTGLPAKIQDSLAVLGLGLWLTWQESWVYGLATSLAFFLDSRLHPPHIRHVAFAGAALLGTLGMAIARDMPSNGVWQDPALVSVVVVASLLFVLVIPASRQIKAQCDATDQRVQPARVQSAQILALVTAIAVAGWTGQQGVVDLFPLWAAMLGTPLYWIVGSLFRRRRKVPPGGSGSA
jgi:hypothetical protein